MLNEEICVQCGVSMSKLRVYALRRRPDSVCLYKNGYVKEVKIWPAH